VHQINRLDLNIAYACNLACKGCLSLSDFDRRGVMPLEDIIESINTWKDHLSPKIVSVFGGEPLLHPRLFNIFDQIKIAWPGSTIRLITNGYLLNRIDNDRWFDIEPLEIQVSIHRLDHEKIITKNIIDIIKQKDDWKVQKVNDDKEGVHHTLEWTRPGTKIWKSKFGEFVIPYNIKDNKISPFNSNPKKAHSICGNPDVPIMYKNKLYKCAPIANILDLPNTKGFNYNPIDSKTGLDKFVKLIGKPESICSMCPESRSHASDHYKQGEVIVKQNIN
jgi:organic radical activating enzyme